MRESHLETIQNGAKNAINLLRLTIGQRLQVAIAPADQMRLAVLFRTTTAARTTNIFASNVDKIKGYKILNAPFSFSTADYLVMAAQNISTSQILATTRMFQQKFGMLKQSATAAEAATMVKQLQDYLGGNNLSNPNIMLDAVAAIRFELNRERNFQTSPNGSMIAEVPMELTEESNLRLAIFAYKLKTIYDHPFDYTRLARARFFAEKAISTQTGNRTVEPTERDQMIKSLYLLNVTTETEFSNLQSLARKVQEKIAKDTTQTVLTRALAMLLWDSPDIPREAMFP